MEELSKELYTLHAELTILSNRLEPALSQGNPQDPNFDNPELGLCPLECSIIARINEVRHAAVTIRSLSARVAL